MISGKDLYEYFEREVDEDDFLEFYIEENRDDVDEDLIDEYREYLKMNNRHVLHDDVNVLFENYTPKDILETIDENFDVMDDYFRLNSYGFVESLSSWEVTEEMIEDDEFLRWYMEEYEVIDWEEANKIIDEANRIAEEMEVEDESI